MVASRKKTPAEALLDVTAAAWPEPLGSGFSVCGEPILEVALSGGLDSVCLLWALAQLAPTRDVSLAAVHVHHGLSRYADRWADFCIELCEQWQIPLRVVRVQVVRDSQLGIEAEARAARYRAFEQGAASLIALAHHADDQAETVLLQALRGAGPHGLAAMPPLREFAAGRYLWRPFLGLPRQELEAVAQQLGLRWVEDDSNDDVRYRRNFLRRQLLPGLVRHLPEYRAQLARTAVRAADAAAILDEVAEEDLARLEGGGALDCQRLAALSPARRRNALARFALDRTGVNLTPAMLDTVLAQALDAGMAAMPEMRQADAVLFRVAGRLHVMRWSEPPEHAAELDLREGEHRLLGWPGKLLVSRKAGQGVRLDRSVVELRVRRGGETMAIVGGHKEVRKILQEAGVSPYLRRRWPLLYCGSALVAIPGIRVDASRLVGPGEAGWWFEWLPD